MKRKCDDLITENKGLKTQNQAQKEAAEKTQKQFLDMKSKCNDLVDENNHLKTQKERLTEVAEETQKQFWDMKSKYDDLIKNNKVLKTQNQGPKEAKEESQKKFSNKTTKPTKKKQQQNYFGLKNILLTLLCLFVLILFFFNNSIYVTHLTFMDPLNGESLLTGELLNNAIRSGISRTQKNIFSIINIRHNELDHMIEDNESNNKKLFNIFFDQNLTQYEKGAKIFNEMMRPNNIDVLISGKYIDEGQYVEIRPLKIGTDKKIISISARFEKNKLLCKYAGNKYLCPGAHEVIAEMVKELLY